MYLAYDIKRPVNPLIPSHYSDSMELKIYQYTEVPEQTYRGLMAADLHGRYFNHHIRGLNYHRLR